MQVRRVVVHTDAQGRSKVQIDAPAARSTPLQTVPGFHPTMVWATEPGDTVGKGPVEDRTPTLSSWVPGPGGTLLMVVTFPPDSVMARPEFDPAAFGAEFGALLPGLAECFEMEHPGMHRTDSVDYDVVLDGTITLELDDGQCVPLQRHDVVVQHGTRHAWRNTSDRPATMLFVLVGAARRAA